MWHGVPLSFNSIAVYRSKRLRHLHAKIDLAAEIHNHLVALQKRNYRRYRGYVGYYRLKRHVRRDAMIELTLEQRQAVAQQGEMPPRAVDPDTQTTYVL